MIQKNKRSYAPNFYCEAGKSDDSNLLLGYARVSKGDDQTNILQAPPNGIALFPIAPVLKGKAPRRLIQRGATR